MKENAALEMFVSLKQFVLWDVSPSHSQLLMRHRESDGNNVDIVFVGVFFMQIPRLFRGLKLEIAPSDQAEAIFEEIGWTRNSNHRKAGTKRIFRITSDGRAYYLGAVGWRVDRNSLGPRESSLEIPGTT